MKYKAHPYANLLPMMTDDEIRDLAEDIKENGLQQPIVKYQDLILDGRNRLRACELAKVEPKFIDHEGDDLSALALVNSLNDIRRHLTPSQRAMYAARRLPEYEVAAEKRKKEGKSIGTNGPEGRARTLAAKAFSVGERQIREAQCLLINAPDLAEKVDAKVLRITNAYEEYIARKKQKSQQEKDKARIAEYQEAIDSGDMTFEQAMEKVMEEERKRKQKAEDYEQGKRLWFAEFARIGPWAQGFVGDHSDEILASFASTHQEPKRIISEIDSIIVHLERLRKIFLRPEDYRNESASDGNGRSPRSQKRATR